MRKVRGATVEAIIGGIFHQFVRQPHVSASSTLNAIVDLGWGGCQNRISYTCSAVFSASDARISGSESRGGLYPAGRTGSVSSS
jgi:hypothetical protein